MLKLSQPELTGDSCSLLAGWLDKLTHSNNYPTSAYMGLQKSAQTWVKIDTLKYILCFLRNNPGRILQSSSKFNKFMMTPLCILITYFNWLTLFGAHILQKQLTENLVHNTSFALFTIKSHKHTQISMSQEITTEK